MPLAAAASNRSISYYGAVAAAIAPQDADPTEQSQGWASTEAAAIRDIVFGISASAFGLAAAYLAYRQLRAMRRRRCARNNPRCGSYSSAEQGSELETLPLRVLTPQPGLGGTPEAPGIVQQCMHLTSRTYYSIQTIIIRPSNPSSLVDGLDVYLSREVNSHPGTAND